MIHIAVFLSAYVRVALKASQQLSVIHYKWGWIPPVSYLMQAAEYVLVAFIARQDPENWQQAILAVLLMGTGAWLGTYTSMWIHRRLQ